MNKVIILIIIIIFSFSLLLSGCVNNSNNDNDNIPISDTEAQQKIIGLWSRTNWDKVQIWEFRENNTLVVYSANLTFNYWFNNNSLFTYLPSTDYFDQYIYSFKNDFNDLTLDLLSNDLIIDPDTGQRIDPGTIIFSVTLVRIK